MVHIYLWRTQIQTQLSLSLSFDVREHFHVKSEIKNWRQRVFVKMIFRRRFKRFLPPS